MVRYVHDIKVLQNQINMTQFNFRGQHKYLHSSRKEFYVLKHCGGSRDGIVLRSGLEIIKMSHSKNHFHSVNNKMSFPGTR